MKYYLSGIADRALARIALDAGITNILIDPDQADTLGLDLIKQFPSVALDSGSYGIWKSGRNPNVTDVRRILNLVEKHTWDFWVMPDILPIPRDGFEPPDPRATAEATHDLWERYKTPEAIPVWHWSEPTNYLHNYMHEGRVGIGGMVRIFRGGHRVKDKEEKARADAHRQQVVDELIKELYLYYSDRCRIVHLFAANHIPSAELMSPLLTSADSSKWLDAARYGYAFFIDEQGRLRYAPQNALKMNKSRAELLALSAQMWRQWSESLWARQPL